MPPLLENTSSLDTHGAYDRITNTEDDHDEDAPTWRGGVVALRRGSGGAAARGSFMPVTIPPKRYGKVIFP